MLHGSTVNPFDQVRSPSDGAAASSTGRSRATRFAFAMAAASLPAAATPSIVSVRVAENPQQPSTSARTPQPMVSVSTIWMICASRVMTKFRCVRPTRASAKLAPAIFAALMAAISRSFVAASIGGSTYGAGGASRLATDSASAGIDATAIAPAASALVARKSRRVVMRIGLG